MPPIRDPSAYPDNWKAVSNRIRFERAGGRCERIIGGERCQAIHKTWIQRSKLNPWNIRPAQPKTPATPGWHRSIHIILTTAHLDHDTTNNVDSNLMAMCQRCHLLYDLDLHKRNAAETRRRKALEQGQGDLFDA